MTFVCTSRHGIVLTHNGSTPSLTTPGINSGPGKWFLHRMALALMILLGSGLSWASFSLTFQGVTQVLSTGSLMSPSGIAVDAAGNIYIADTGNNEIVLVNPQGVASVLTITLSPALSSPAGITVDGAGNLYIADTGNNRVVKVTFAGASSVVSMGSVTLNAPKGIAVDPSGNLFIADTGNNQLVEVPSGGAAGVLTITGLSSPSTLSGPIGLAADVNGKLYVADSGNNRIVSVAAGGTAGTAVGIAGGVTLNTPSGVAVDNFGNVYIADTGNNRIAEVDTAGNGTVLRTNQPVAVTLSSPKGVAVDVFGAVYIADTSNDQAVVSDPPVNANVTSSDPTYSLNKTAVGFGHVQLGSSTPVSLTLAFTIGSSPALSAARVFTAGTQSLDFTATTGASNCNSGDSSTLCYVYVEFLPTAPGLRTGAVVLYDNATPANPMLTVPLYGFSDSPVAALSPNTGAVIGTGGLATLNPYQLTLDGAGNMYVGVYSGKNVTKVAAGGGSASLVTLGSPASVAVQNITGVALDGAGNLFIGDHQNSRILVVTPGGVVSVLSITGLSPALGFPVALASDAAGNLYIADFTGGRIVKISSLVVAGLTSSGKATVIGTGSFSFSGSTVTGMTVDSQGTIYIAARTQNSSRIIKVTALGVATAVAIPGNITPAISNPQGVGMDAMGNLYIVDTGNSRIVKMTTAGVASLLSVSGLPNPSTLGSTLFGVTVDASGNLYISDWTNNRIVFVNVSGAALTFNSTKVGLTSTDSPKTATVTNLGNQALVFSADPVFTADFSSPPGGVNQCLSQTSLAAGMACNVSLQFTPQSVGSLSAGITVTDNTLNVASSTQQVSASGTGITPGDTTATAVTASPSPANIGQPITVTGTLTDTAAGHTATIPTGSVTFLDTVGSTVVSLNGGSPVSLSAGHAILTAATLSGAGSHTITANYAGVSGSYLASSNTTTLSVTKAPVTVAGPVSHPFQVTSGQTGSLPITVTGPYSGLAAPSGTVSYDVLDSSSTSVASGSPTLTAGSTDSTASVPIASSLAAGTYTVSVTYGGDSNYAVSSTATTIQVLVGQIAPTISWTAPASAITYGTALSALLNASAANGSTAVAGVFSYTAARTGGSAGAAVGATVLSAGSYTLTVTFTPTDTTTYTSATATVPLTVAKAAPAVALTSSANTVLSSNSVTFTATVSSAVSTPTGSVNFYDGTTLLGSGTLAQGAATYATTSLAVGAHTTTAAYAGDSNFSALTSAALTETVQDFSLNVSSSGQTSAIVSPGGIATYALTISPLTGTTFPSPVTLTVSGVPPGATARLTPSTLAAGTGPTAVSLTIQLPSQTASLRPSNLPALNLSTWMVGMLLLPFSGRIRRAAGSQGRKLSLLLLIVTGAAVVGLAGCGARNSGFFGNPQKSYVITVTATSGTLAHSTTLSLTVQ